MKKKIVISEKATAVMLAAAMAISMTACGSPAKDRSKYGRNSSGWRNKCGRNCIRDCRKYNGKHGECSDRRRDFGCRRPGYRNYSVK